LKAQGSKLDPALFAALPHRSSSTSSRKSTAQQVPLAAAAAAADPDSLLADIAVAQQLSNDTAVLNDAITTLITSYQEWHGEHIQVRADITCAAQHELADSRLLFVLC
jgi:glutamate-1-semialdehyde aminotransferase